VNIPNFITIGRLLLVPLIVWLIIADQPDLAFWVFVIAGVSDAVDGFLARQLDLRTDLGTYLDPIADKTMLVSTYVTLAIVSAIPVWVTILVVSRDFLIVGAVVLSWMLGEPVVVRPLPISKLNTLLQIALVGFVLADFAFTVDLSVVTTVLVYLVGVLTLASAAVYLYDWVRHMAAGEAAARTSEPTRESGMRGDGS
jgi:cardiolipin synthase